MTSQPPVPPKPPEPRRRPGRPKSKRLTISSLGRSEQARLRGQFRVTLDLSKPLFDKLQEKRKTTAETEGREEDDVSLREVVERLCCQGLGLPEPAPRLRGPIGDRTKLAVNADNKAASATQEPKPSR
jgi:hypothetical protein